MVQIRIVSKDQNQVLEWTQRAVRMAHNYTDTEHLSQSRIEQGRKGDYLIYITINEQAKPDDLRQAAASSASTGSAQGAARPAPPTLGDELRNINIYTALGQLWGLAEAIIGDIEPDVTDLIQDHIWSTIGDSRRDRIRWLFDSLPTDYVLEAIRAAKEEESVTGYNMLDYPGLYWPKFFYLFALTNPDTKNGRAVLKEFINPDPPPVIRLRDE